MRIDERETGRPKGAVHEETYTSADQRRQEGKPPRTSYTPANQGRQEGKPPRTSYTPANQGRQEGEIRRMPYASSDQGRMQQYQEEVRRQRYRQEQMQNNWQQSWERRSSDEEEEGFTPVQYVLIGLTVVLLLALIGFGAFWIFGRGGRKNDSGQNGNIVQEIQTETMPQQGNVIEILGGGQASVSEAETVQQETVKETSGTGMIQTEETQTETTQTEAVQDIVLNYPDFSVTLPGSWKGKYGISQNGNFYTFYHQDSKACGYGGEFFTIARYTDTSYKDVPGAEVIGTGNGAAYICFTPTDVPYPPDNQNVAREYRQMKEELGETLLRIRLLVSGEGPKETEAAQVIEIQSQEQADYSGGYITYSSSQLLTDTDVTGMTYDDLQMAINEIYARHGRTFSSETIQSYFDSMPWYNGTIAPEDFSDSVFSSIEAQNIQFLLKKMGVQQ